MLKERLTEKWAKKGASDLLLPGKIQLAAAVAGNGRGQASKSHDFRAHGNRAIAGKEIVSHEVHLQNSFIAF